MVSDNQCIIYRQAQTFDSSVFFIYRCPEMPEQANGRMFRPMGLKENFSVFFLFCFVLKLKRSKK